MKKKLLLTSLLLSLSFVATSCVKTELETDKKTIYMGTNAEFIPFEFIADNGVGVVGKYDGIDVAIVNHIANSLGYDLQIEDMAFDFLIPSLSSDKIDFIASAFSIIDERQMAVDFTIPYFESKQLLLVNKNNIDIQSSDDFDNKLIGVQLGNTADFILSDSFPNVTVNRYTRFIDAIFDLKSNKIDGILLDSYPANSLYAVHNEFLDIIDVSNEFEPESYGIAFSKDDDSGLLAEFNAELTKMIEDGTLEQLISNYSE
jgi:arginine/lysine/histidine transporter system substrate-binding protein